jgi:hypothetical protein
MKIGTHWLPAEDRVVLAFDALIQRLAAVEPDATKVYPEAFEVATKWTIAGEKPEEMALALTTAFFEMLEKLARRERGL